MNNLYDLHCHVLPGVDDGCKTLEETLAVLTESYKQSIQGIIATPHYYPKESIASFLSRRNNAIDELNSYLINYHYELPNIFLGAEVAYYDGISSNEDLDLLCFGNTRYMLIELPFEKWKESVLKELERIYSIRGITPIIAHIERYIYFQDKKTIKALFNLNIMIQMNAEFILSDFSKAKKFIKKYRVDFLGSDCHNTGKRAQNLSYAFEMLVNKKMTNLCKTIQQSNKKMFYAVKDSNQNNEFEII